MKKNFLKVLFINHSSNMAGAERVLLELLIGLKKYNIISKVVVPYYGNYTDQLVKHKIDFVVIPFTWWANKEIEEKKVLAKKYRQNLKAIYQIADLITHFKPDLVYSNTLANPWGAIASTLTNTKHIWGIHEFGDIDHGLKFHLGKEYSYKLINNLSDAVITNCIAVKNYISKYVNPLKNFQFYYHIDLPDYYKKNDYHKYFSKKESLKLSVLGTIMPSKGQLDAIKSINLINNKNIELCIVGPVEDISYFNQITNFIKENKLANKIYLHNFSDKPLNIIKQSDVIILPSFHEAISRVVFESMLLGKAVIGTNSGGTPEQIINGYNGLLYEPGNIVQLAEKIGYFLKNPNKIKSFGINARKYSSKKFTKSNYFHKIYNLFNQIKLKEKFLSYDIDIYDIYKHIKKISDYGTVNRYDQNPLLEFIKNSQKTIDLLNKKRIEKINRLTKKKESLLFEIHNNRNEIKQIEFDLNKIQNAKFYKLWQFYTKIIKILKLKKYD